MSVADLELMRPRTAFVEPVTPSGVTESGIYILDHDSAKGVDNRSISLIYRVLKKHPTCKYLEDGKVYIVQSPYAFSVAEYEGVEHYIMAEDNFLSEVDGYDEARA